MVAVHFLSTVDQIPLRCARCGHSESSGTGTWYQVHGVTKTALCPEEIYHLTTPIRNFLVHQFRSRPSIYETRAFSSRKPRYTHHAVLPHPPFCTSEGC